MPTGRPLTPLTLSAEEKAKLDLLTRRPKTDQRTAQRSRIVLELRRRLKQHRRGGQARSDAPNRGPMAAAFSGRTTRRPGRCAALGPAPQAHRCQGRGSHHPHPGDPAQARHWTGAPALWPRPAASNKNAIVRICQRPPALPCGQRLRPLAISLRSIGAPLASSRICRSTSSSPPTPSSWKRCATSSVFT